jgi:hypothetical protein
MFGVAESLVRLFGEQRPAFARMQEVVMLGLLLSWNAFASLFVLAQFSFSLERFVAHFTLILSGRLVHD